VRPYIQHATEDAGKCETVVDLVGKVAAPGRDDLGSRFQRLPRPNLRYGIGTGENDGVAGHAADPTRFDHAGSGL